MRQVSRRHFLRVTAGGAAGVWALGQAPAVAQTRELTFLTFNHFVPASDDELRKQADAFGKLANCEVRVDTIAHLQLPAKFAAEAQAPGGYSAPKRFVVQFMGTGISPGNWWARGEGAGMELAIGVGPVSPGDQPPEYRAGHAEQHGANYLHGFSTRVP